MRAAKVQASLRIRAVSPDPSLFAHTSSESRGTFRQKARSLAPLNGWACAVKIYHDGMLEDTNSLDGAHLLVDLFNYILGKKRNAATGLFILKLYCFQKRIKIRKLETKLIENVFFFFFLLFSKTLSIICGGNQRPASKSMFAVLITVLSSTC